MGKKSLIILTILIGLIILQKKCAVGSSCAAKISYANVDINEGIDKGQLFAPITAAEKDTVLADWKAIDLAPKDVEDLGMTFLSGARLYTVSHTVMDQTHYGAITTPAAMQDSLRYPILIFSYGLDQRHPVVHLGHSGLQHLLRELGQQYIVIIPSFRGQALKSTYYNYCSEGFFGDAFDGATDDAIALLNVALDRYPQADSNRVVAYGGSRGGTVSLLLGIRDLRVKRVLAQAAPTDFSLPRVMFRYGIQYKYQFLSHKIPIVEIRRKMLKSSPLHFAEYLPETWVEHGYDDRTVPRKQVEMLRERLGDSLDIKQVKIEILQGKGHQLGLAGKHFDWLKEWAPEPYER